MCSGLRDHAVTGMDEEYPGPVYVDASVVSEAFLHRERRERYAGK